MNVMQNVFAYISEMLIHVCVAVTEYKNAQTLQETIPFLILLLVFFRIMLQTVKLYYNFSTCNVKINNIMTKNLLTVRVKRMKFEKVVPQMAFFLGHFPAKTLGIGAKMGVMDVAGHGDTPVNTRLKRLFHLISHLR